MLLNILNVFVVKETSNLDNLNGIQYFTFSNIGDSSHINVIIRFHANHVLRYTDIHTSSVKPLAVSS